MHESLLQQLQNIGLNQKEAGIYLALLENGEMTISELAGTTKLQRTSLYDIIPPLIQSGFISKVPGGKKLRYQAEPAENLPLLLEARAKQIEQLAKKAHDLVPTLKRISIQSATKPSITIYEGEQGLKSLYDTTLKCKTFIRSFLTADTLEEFDSEYVNNYFKRRARKGIHIRGILNNSGLSRGYQKKSKEFLREINLVPPEKMDIVPEIYLYDDMVTIFSLKEKLGISLCSKDIANAFKKLYDLAWERAEQYNKELKTWPGKN